MPVQLIKIKFAPDLVDQVYRKLLDHARIHLG